MSEAKYDTRMYVENEELAKAVMESDYEGIKRLHGQKEELDSRCVPFLRGITPLMAASLNNDVEMIEVLIGLGVDIDKDEFYHGNSALLFAAGQGNYEACQKLLELGADVTYVNRYSMDASDVIDDVIQSGDPEAVAEMEKTLEDMPPEVKEIYQPQVLPEETKKALLRTKELFA